MKIFIKTGTGYCGEDNTDIIEVPDDSPNEYIDRLVYEMSWETAEMYGRCVYDEEEIQEMGDQGDYDSGCIIEDELEYSWEVYDPKKHNAFIGGGEHPLMEYE